MRGRRVAWVSILMMAGAMAGCIAPSDGFDVEVLSAAEDPASWSRIELSHAGEAGDWLAFYHPLPAPVDELSFGFTVAIAAAGAESGPTGLWASRPSPRWDFGEGPHYAPFHVFNERGPLYVDPAGGPVVYESQENWGASVGSGVFTGFAFMVGANTPWTLEFELTLEGASGGTVAPAFLTMGMGAFVLTSDDPLLPGDGSVASVVDLDATLDAPGWTHLQYDYHAVQPIGARAYDIAFPNGFAPSGVGTISGFHAVVMGQASSSNWLDFAGTPNGSAGDFTSRLVGAQAQLGLSGYLIHLPFGEEPLPQGLTWSDYRGTIWPFHGLPLLAWEDSETERSLSLRLLE